jgi:nitrosocyanin
VHNLRRLSAVALLGLSLVLAGCGGHATVRRSIDAAVVGGGAGFDPSTVTVHKDDNVRLTVGNTTDKTHGFSVEGYGIHDEVNPGTPLQVKFKAKKPGTFKIFCQLHPAHRIATLVVQ